MAAAAPTSEALAKAGLIPATGMRPANNFVNPLLTDMYQVRRLRAGAWARWCGWRRHGAWLCAGASGRAVTETGRDIADRLQPRARAARDTGTPPTL